MRIGYNRHPDDGMMNYRYKIQIPLEKSDYIEKSPFQQFPIVKGQNRGLDSSLSKGDRVDISGNKSNIKIAGYFKGLVRIIPIE
mmetsp:Transcript_17730/g.2911  ORF Transcript_17730/g.2911 Transcript_17730/m.2911 type:complete len:84 (-) Transcript_17730:1260-1511(-)